MTKIFNQQSLKLISEIKEHCSLYQKNHREFSELVTKAKLRKHLNPNDLMQSEHLISLMNNGEIRVIFCGQVKSGKSRLVMEFLSGAISLPSKDTPATTFFTKLFYSDKAVLYSENSRNEKDFHDFDGKNVHDDLVGKRRNFMIEEHNLDLIYHIGIPDEILKDSVIVIDSPGLNETKSLDDAFKMNLMKMNPQIVIYIFNYGPGFIDSDDIYYTAVTANLRKALRKIFVFNKFDEAFKHQPEFPKNVDSDESSSEDSNCVDDESESDDEEPNDFLKRYEEEYKKHMTKLEEVHKGCDCPCLIGYSGKFTQLHREKKEKKLPMFRDKHLQLLEHVRYNINSVNLDTIESILSFTNQILFSDFKLIYRQILDSNQTNQRQELLSGLDKEKLISRFDVSHEKLINIIITQIPQINFDGAISQIVKNQERVHDEFDSSKFSNLVGSLAKFFIDRYNNYFSNIILTKLEEISFEKLIDDLRQKGIDHLLSHTLCSLSFETEKIEKVIKLYFNEESERIIHQKEFVEKPIFRTLEACTFYINSNFRFQKEHIWIKVNEFINNIIVAERKLLEQSIEEKKKEIITIFKVSKDQSNEMIKNAVFFLKKLFVFHNNLLKELSKSASERKEFFCHIIDGTIQNREEAIKCADHLGLLVKTEDLNLVDLSYDNCELIKYFLRSQYLRSDTCEVNYYYREKEQRLCFITDVEGFVPLRLFLNGSQTEIEKKEMVKKLIAIVLICHEKCLPIDNLGPDMIFCRKVSSEIEVKVAESTQKFMEWKYTLDSGEISKFPPHKYPFYQSETSPSMFYSLGWIILLIQYGRCENCFNVVLDSSNFAKEVDKRFPTWKKQYLFTECCKIIKSCLQRPFKTEKINDIVRIFEDISKN